MTKALTNYDKTKISTAHIFLQYDQTAMIHKYSLDYNSDWLYITFINRTYRINRKTGNVQRTSALLVVPGRCEILF